MKAEEFPIVTDKSETARTLRQLWRQLVTSS